VQLSSLPWTSITAAQWQALGQACLTATIRLGDLSANPYGAAEFSIGGTPGQYAWPQIPGDPGTGVLWTTGWTSVQAIALPGGGSSNVSLTLDTQTVPGGSKTYGNITSVVVQASAATLTDGSAPWEIDWKDLACTFYDSLGVGTPSDTTVLSSGPALRSKNNHNKGQVLALSGFKKVLAPGGNPSVRVEIVGSIQMTAYTNAPAGRPSNNDLLGKIYIYSDSCF
jgi:hypothetical protein